MSYKLLIAENIFGIVILEAKALMNVPIDYVSKMDEEIFTCCDKPKG
jgi:hypothetical protein